MTYTVYYVDKSVGDVLGNRAVTLDEKIFFSDLANAHYRGQCYLCGDINALEEVSQQVSEIYGMVMQHYAEGRAVMEVVQKVFVLSYTSDVSTLPDILQCKEKYQFIPVQAAINEKWQLRECVLLGENLDDCAFYRNVAEWYCQQQELTGISMHFHQMGGGGSTVRGALKNCVKAEKRPTLCLVDSDQKYGETRLTRGQVSCGETYRQAAEVSRDLRKPNFPPHRLCRLDVHEVENLIPTQILQELKKDFPNMVTGLERLKKLQMIRSGEPALYYDYKNGFPYIKDQPARAYWREIVNELGGKEENMPGTQKQEKGSYNPNALFFPPISGNNLLEHAIAKMKKAEWMVDEYLMQIWEQIGVVMLTWGFASAPIYA